MGAVGGDRKEGVAIQLLEMTKQFAQLVVLLIAVKLQEAWQPSGTIEQFEQENGKVQASQVPGKEQLPQSIPASVQLKQLLWIVHTLEVERGTVGGEGIAGSVN